MQQIRNNAVITTTANAESVEILNAPDEYLKVEFVFYQLTYRYCINVPEKKNFYYITQYNRLISCFYTKLGNYYGTYLLLLRS